MNSNFAIYVCLFFLSLTGCSGIKVINPNDKNPNSGTLALDTSSGKMKLVATYTCELNSNGKKILGLGKTEADARKEVLSKCHDRTLISFCDPEKVTCVKN